MGEYALINVPIASLHKEPTRNCSLEDEALYGMKVEVLSEVSKDWVAVRTHYRYEGLVCKSELLRKDEMTADWDAAEKMTVIGPYADVLTLPKVQGANVISLTRGAVVRLLEPAGEGGWVKVGLADRREGYMKEKFLGEYRKASLDPSVWVRNEEEFRDQVCAAAMSYLGTQYRWGGKTTLGIDCSGLCSMAYLLNGVIVYRDAKIMEGFPLRQIPYENKKKGDLLFFPGHVAMYLGDGRYVHSTGKNGSDGVVINSLNPGDFDYREDLKNCLNAVGSIF